jgi:hypothetical protein
MHDLLVEREVVMKTALLNQIVQTLLMLTVAVAFVGCGSGKGKLKSSPAVPTPVLPVAPPTDTGATKTWPFSVTGDTVALVPSSWEELNSYVGIRPLNNPSNVMINMTLKPVAGYNIHSGTVRIGYTDNAQFYYGEFTVGDGKNEDCDHCQNNGDYEAAYNYWTTINGKNTFMAYFQDQYGSLILVLEDALGTGDASGSSLLNGRVFYRNFAQSIYPQSPYRKCWYIYSGPYACYSSVMAAKSSSTEIDGYKLLGSFSGVQRNKAFTN